MFAASKTASVSGGYQISRSLRFNTADTAYLVRAPSTTTNRRTFTWSAWVKRSEITPYQSIFSANDNTFATAFGGDQQWQVFFDVGAYAVNTAQVFRDPSAWYHLVVAVDTTQATASNRVKMYVNGTQVTAFAGSPSYPPQNFDTAVNQASSNHRIGAGPTYASNWFGGYQADVYLIDGQQLTPSSFGAIDVQTGVWGPTAFTGGAFGTNGFYVNFSDNSNTTAATLGKDYSGNGNNFTPTNLSVTAGAGNDSLVDVPTSYGVDTGVGGTVRGNYSTLNPLNLGASATLANGNLDHASTSGAWTTALSTIGMTSGKWYFEATMTSTGEQMVGIANQAFTTSTYLGANSNSWAYYSTGFKYFNASASAYGTAYSNGAVIGVALDLDAGTVTFYANGSNQGQAFSGLTGPLFFGVSGISSTTRVVNFGQRPFAYTAPSGFKALCTQNLPTPTIGATTATQAGKFFAPVLYTGTGANLAVTVGFQPDFIWTKSRSATDNQVEVDALRGIGSILIVNSTGAESAYGAFVSFDTNGFTKAAAESISGRTYVAWNWKANGSGSTNTAGSITSTASANTTSGFSVVTFTGNSTAGATIGHGLGVAPAMVIMKNRVGPDSWQVYHKSLPSAAYRMQLNNTAAADVENTVWNSTAPTSTVFSVGTNVGNSAQVAYCFASVDGYSAFGSYVGNGSASGPFVYTGFKPAFLLIRSTGVESWFLFDTARGTYNDNMPFLQANTNGPEYAFDTPEIMSNGFKLSTSNSSVNGSGNTMIYAAFAETPFKYSLAR
jgi:hypothetical protein